MKKVREYGDDRDDFIHRLPLARIYAGKTILKVATRARRKKVRRADRTGAPK